MKQEIQATKEELKEEMSKISKLLEQLVSHKE
jgi:hypothetical protein